MLRSIALFFMCSWLLHTSAQNINIGLHPTAVPDSFEVRLNTDAGVYSNALLSALVFTVRWESAAGGAITAANVATGCPDYDIVRSGPIAFNGSYAFQTFVVFGFTPMGPGCEITTTPAAIGGFKINNLSGCRRVGIVNDAYTTVTNRNYYISINGVDLTGSITTSLYETGPCAPCVPAQIDSVLLQTFPDPGPPCGGLSGTASVVASGSDLQIVWTIDAFDGFTDTFHFQNREPGRLLYLSVSNSCGADSEVLTVEVDSSMCTAPVIASLSHSPWNGSPGTVVLDAQIAQGDGCLISYWLGPNNTVVAATANATINITAPGIYEFRTRNVCGSDTAQLLVEADTACIAPVVADLQHAPWTCPTGPVTFQAQLAQGSTSWYDWSGASPLLDGQPTATTGAPVEGGTYQVIVSNACGADTASTVLNIDTAACTPPSILWLQHSLWTCANASVTFTAQTVPGASCLQYDWSGPSPLQNAQSSAIASVPVAGGTYQVIVSNICGADTASIVLTLDTTACTPPSIVSLTNPPWICPNSSVTFTATLAPGSSCLAYDWSGPTNPPDGAATSTISSNIVPGTYQVIVSNACGTDTASLDLQLDTAACTPPVISSLQHATWSCGAQSMYLQVFYQGNSCLEFDWSGPGPVLGSNHKVLAWPPVAGTYQVVLSNPCGADTAQVLFAPDTASCAPLIAYIEQSGWNWAMDPVALEANLMQGSGNIQFAWSGPSDLPDGSSITSAPQALPGLYQVIASNQYGSDTAAYVLTTALPCVPPTVGSISGGEWACEGGALSLSTSMTGSDSMAYIVWDGPLQTTTPDGSLICNSTDARSGEYSVLVANGCGTATASINVSAISANNGSKALCNDEAPFDLAQSLLTHQPGGTWTLNGAAHGPLYDPAADASGTYVHHDPSGLGCPDVAVEVVEHPRLSAGQDGALTVCSSDLAVDLMQVLNGDPDANGTWMFGMASATGWYDPAVDAPGAYTYEHSVCGDGVATIIVTEEGAGQWFADADGDGIGETANAVWACDAPVGYVPSAGDDCPLSPGVIGDPCDDGSPWTYDDVLQTDCSCAGTIAMGVGDQGPALPIVLWPQPCDGGSLYVLLGADRPMVLRTLDAGGRIIREHGAAPQINATVTELNYAPALPNGIYAVQVQWQDGVATKRFVVQR